MKKIFLKLPYIIKFILINIYSLFLKRKRFNKNFFKNLHFYNNLDYTENHRINFDLVKEQIKGNRFFKIKNKIEDYPIINKKDLKDNYDLIINQNKVNDYLTTSGSTGSGFKFPITNHFIEHQWAIFWKFRNVHGINLNTWCANIISQTMFDINSNKNISVKSFGTKQLLLSQYHLNKDNVKRFIDQIIINNIKWLHAFPSVLHLFATLIKENDLVKNAKKINLNIITTSSEKLHSFQKELIEDIFNTNVRELYGLTEGVVNIFECEKNSLHIDESYSYVELIPNDEEDEYQIIGTSYHNKAFPLIRYNTGDTCTLYSTEYKCSCGRKSRVVKEILGRDEDYLILENSSKIGRLSSIFKKLTEVKESQIFQKEKGKAIFRIVKSKDYTKKSEDVLKMEIAEKLGNNFNYKIDYVKSIQKTKNGKLKFVISKINE